MIPRPSAPYPLIRFANKNDPFRLFRRIRGMLGSGAEEEIRSYGAQRKAQLGQEFTSRGLYGSTRMPVMSGEIDRSITQDIMSERARLNQAALGAVPSFWQMGQKAAPPAPAPQRPQPQPTLQQLYGIDERAAETMGMQAAMQQGGAPNVPQPTAPTTPAAPKQQRGPAKGYMIWQGKKYRSPWQLRLATMFGGG